MIIDELVTDRTQADVDRIKSLQQKSYEDMSASEQNEWMLGSTVSLSCADGLLYSSTGALECYDGIIKGSYNFNDLNRIGEAITYLENELHDYGYTIHTNPKKDWNRDDIPTLAQLNKLLEDVEICRAKLQLASSVPVTPSSMIQIDYIKANNIEKILEAVHYALMRIVVGMIVYCDDVFCGEV